MCRIFGIFYGDMDGVWEARARKLEKFAYEMGRGDKIKVIFLFNEDPSMPGNPFSGGRNKTVNGPRLRKKLVFQPSLIIVSQKDKEKNKRNQDSHSNTANDFTG